MKNIYKIYFKCKNCKKEDSFPKSQLKKYPNSGKFCSIKCKNNFYNKNPGTHPSSKEIVYHSQGYLLESGTHKFMHRKIMEENIGRKLRTKEIVHHINGNREDNRIENLMLFKNQSEHIKYHHKILYGNNCRNGHIVSKENTWINKEGKKFCRACRCINIRKRNIKLGKKLRSPRKYFM